MSKFLYAIFVITIFSFESVLQSAQPLTTPLMAGEAVVYKRVQGRELRLFVDKPDSWKASDRRPAIVFFHGGGWREGSPKQFENQSRHFAARGAVCFNVEYRLVKEKNTPPDVCIADAKSAMRYVRSHVDKFGIDQRKIAAFGGSAGGHLAAATALMPSFDDAEDNSKISARPDALVLFNPVIDTSPEGHGSQRLGERWREYSPAHQVTRIAPPTIIFVGSEDKFIPKEAVERFCDDMQQAGVRCEAKIYEGQTHGFFNYRDGQNRYYHETLSEADAFLTSLGWLAEAGESK
jgi:acetyl esterase